MPEYANKSQVWSTVGMWAWLLHRITGIAIACFIVLHIILISTGIFRGPEAFNAELALLLGNPFFLVLDFLLTGAVLYHALNGIRLLLFDFGIGYGRQKEIFWSFMVSAWLF
jgi:succinate dehydrogenase / fumarate reductase cytochrome b subunit